MGKIIEAAILSEGRTKLRLTLSTGEVIIGYSLGRVPALDESEDELDIDAISIQAVTTDAYLRLREADILQVETAS